MTAWIAVATGTAAVLFAAAAALLARRNAALRDELRNVQEGGREVAGSLDLDDVVARILDGALALPQVEAAVLSLAGDEKGSLVKSAGMTQAEAEQRGELGSKAAASLDGELGPLGSLTVYSGTERRLAEKVGESLEDVVRRGVPALENAFRYREARRHADTDALTGLRNRRFFYETLQRECKRAQRYGRSLALLVLDLDDFKSINESVGHLAGDEVLAEAGARMRAVLRASDIACRVGGDEFAIVLPEAGGEQAAQLYQRIQAAVSASPVGAIEKLTLSGGVTALIETDDATTFFERADAALYRSKESGKARLFVG